jgi:hypothetical protein
MEMAQARANLQNSVGTYMQTGSAHAQTPQRFSLGWYT